MKNRMRLDGCGREASVRDCLQPRAVRLATPGPHAAFTTVKAALLRPLPVADPSSLAVASLGPQFSMSYPSFAYLREYSRSLDGLVAFRALEVNVASGGGTQRRTALLVSGNYFSMLGVEMERVADSRRRLPHAGGWQHAWTGRGVQPSDLDAAVWW
jgi:hypothetical protein